LSKLEAPEKEKPPEWTDILCSDCPFWDVFPFKVECQAGCGEKHDEEQGLCRISKPVISAPHGKGVWPVTNCDDWCAEGRDVVWELIRPAEATPEASDPSTDTSDKG